MLPENNIKNTKDNGKLTPKNFLLCLLLIIYLAALMVLPASLATGSLKGGISLLLCFFLVGLGFAIPCWIIEYIGLKFGNKKR